MHADLMRASRFELHAYEGMRAKTTLDAVMRDRLTTVSSHCHPRSLGAMPTDRFVDGAASRHHALAECEVLAAHRSLGERTHEHRLRFGRTCYDEQSRRVLVESMHDARARNASKLRIEFQQGILERAL